MKKILIIGATSAIAEATARIWAEQGYSLYLAGRDQERLSAIAGDLAVRGATVTGTYAADLADVESHAALLAGAVDALGGLDVALIAHGTLSDQRACEADAATMLSEFTVNALSVMSLATLLANRFEQQGHGCLAVIGSVAGDRGRASNYVYGSAKAAVATFLQGLRQRLHKSGVTVLTVKPGFVDTPMTTAFRKGLLWAQPGTVAANIARAVERGSDVLYTPFFWRQIMLVIRLIPETIFKRLPL